MTQTRLCRTPTPGKQGTPVPEWKFDAVRGAILAAVQEAGRDGVAFADLSGEVRARLPDEVLGRLGSVGWHVTVVKLEMEVAGDLARRAVRGRQRLVAGPKR